MRPDSLLRLWRYINHLLTYLLIQHQPKDQAIQDQEIQNQAVQDQAANDHLSSVIISAVLTYFIDCLLVFRV